jgi:hypothetical protein
VKREKQFTTFKGSKLVIKRKLLPSLLDLKDYKNKNRMQKQRVIKMYDVGLKLALKLSNSKSYL